MKISTPSQLYDALIGHVDLCLSDIGPRLLLGNILLVLNVALLALHKGLLVMAGHKIADLKITAQILC